MQTITLLVIAFCLMNGLDALHKDGKITVYASSALLALGTLVAAFVVNALL